jgi:hypothetical protein
MKNCNTKTCYDESCQCQAHECKNTTKSCEGHGGFFLELGDCAWTEVLKEKIKALITQQDGECLNELARIIVEGNKKRWENKMCKEHGCHEFEENLCSYFNKKCEKKK